MTVLVYDGSWFGFLTAVFEVYEYKLKEVNIETASRFQARVFSDDRQVISDQHKALRVWNGLKKRLSAAGCRSVYYGYLSEKAGIEDLLLRFIQLAFQIEEAEKAFANPVVLSLTQVAKSVYREKHRMEAFVRFKLTKDAIYFATIEPDFNVLPVITTHFEKRYADQKWLIYDVKRQYGVYYDLHSLEEVSMQWLDAAANANDHPSVFNEDEVLYQHLWKDYFKHVNIAERKNTKLHVQHVPKRYWKYLIEKNLD